ncbi:helix-turn-helix domain-containing protein [Azospirillum agricola]|uniref:helix-turn-helix domain-containing protein n=1 Tax=Azospirillum agricola TaxID=1720247 RepID=UPI000A0F0A2D|nr:helix-turn-helix domain-containing protein [Azospirillum agricola]SMH28675.1 transcriptional regulator, AraC family [Azospirillum lipoferum]
MADTGGEASPVLRFDSAGMAPEEGFWLWRDQMSPIFEISVPDRDAVGAFHGVLETYHMGSVLLGRCASVTQSFERSRPIIARSGIDHYLVQFQHRGDSRGRMGAREVDVRTGDVCILDLAQTVSTVDHDIDTLTLCLPREMLAPLVVDPDALHGLVLPGRSPLGAMLAGHVRSLHRVASTLSAREALSVARGAAAFVAGCLGPTVDALDLVRPEMQASRVRAIKRHIDSHLGDPQLDAARIAEAFRMSRPTLYRLFEPMGGVAAYILQRRLARSLADLMAHRPQRIADIARRWGFSSETAFSRAFRAAFGMAPRDARANSQRVSNSPTNVSDAFKRWFHELAVL